MASPAVGAMSLASALSVDPEPANFAVVCQTTVGGVCLLAELDIVFDQQFQQRYPSTYQDQAAALLNMVDGYFRNDMKIQFDVLSMNFPATDLFSTTLDANDLLTDITTKKNSGPDSVHHESESDLPRRHGSTVQFIDRRTRQYRDTVFIDQQHGHHADRFEQHRADGAGGRARDRSQLRRQP